MATSTSLKCCSFYVREEKKVKQDPFKTTATTDLSSHSSSKFEEDGKQAYEKKNVRKKMSKIKKEKKRNNGKIVRLAETRLKTGEKKSHL